MDRSWNALVLVREGITNKACRSLFPLSVWCATLVVAAWGRCSAADREAARGGVPSTIRYFEEVVPVVGGATRGCLPGTSIHEHRGHEHVEAACEVPLDQFHLTFSAFGEAFDVLVIGRAPTGEPHGPECFAPDQLPEEVDGRAFFHRHDGLACRPTAAPLASFPVPVEGPNSHGVGSLLLRDGEWLGSIEVGGEIYVLRPRSSYDSYAPLGTIIIYRYTDADNF